MKDIEPLFSKTIEELERMLKSKTVVGDPITVGGQTLIPLVSIGFGFAVAGGSGNDPKKGDGVGGGTGGGGGIKPIALVVVDEAGVRVDPVMGGGASVLGKAIDTIGSVVQKRTQTESGEAK